MLPSWFLHSVTRCLRRLQSTGFQVFVSTNTKRIVITSMGVCLWWLLTHLEKQARSPKLFLLKPTRLFSVLSLHRCFKKRLQGDLKVNLTGGVQLTFFLRNGQSVCTVLPCHQNKIYLLTYCLESFLTVKFQCRDIFPEKEQHVSLPFQPSDKGRHLC